MTVEGQGRRQRLLRRAGEARDLERLLVRRPPGITEAQRYPDFDAIVAGAPAVNWMRLHGARMAINQRVHAREDSYITPDKYPAIHQAMLKACDASDGIKDGVVEDPTALPVRSQGARVQGPGWARLPDAGRVETAGALRAAQEPQTGATIFPSLLAGLRAELGDAGRPRSGQHGV
jgi:feruloyl esterase